MDFNKCIFIGKVQGAPQISDVQGHKQAVMKFALNDRKPGANGQWVDNPVYIDVFARDNKADVIEKYVVDGQELTIECKYTNWDENGVVRHAFQMFTVALGFKPKAAGPVQANVPAGPPL